MACRPGTMLLARNASLPGQICSSAVTCRSQRVRWAPATVAHKSFMARSRCIDRPNVYARRLCKLAATSVEALGEGIARSATLLLARCWYLKLSVWLVICDENRSSFKLVSIHDFCQARNSTWRKTSAMKPTMEEACPLSRSLLQDVHSHPDCSSHKPVTLL